MEVAMESSGQGTWHCKLKELKIRLNTQASQESGMRWSGGLRPKSKKERAGSF